MNIIIVFLLFNPFIFAFFNNKNEIQGNVGFGKVPEYINPILNNFSHQIDLITNEEHMKHIYISELSTSLKNNFQSIKNDSFWYQLAENNHSKVLHIDGMEELYYSNPKFKNNNNMIGLYGSTNNLYLHRDCEFICTFPNVKVYRVLIGLSNNENMITNIPYANVSHKLQKYDYLFFDYSRTHHQVLKDNTQLDNNARKMIKIHFMIIDDSTSEFTELFLKTYFKTYNSIFRFWSNMGLEPETYSQFFFGLSNEFFYTSYITQVVSLLYLFSILHMYITYNIDFKAKNMLKFIGYPSLSIFTVYCSIVFLYWFRYKLYDIR